MKQKPAKSRSDLILATFKFCRKEYPAITPPSNRTVLEHMLYGCCLENSQDDAADEVFARLQQNFFDWNEVRVTTAAELAEIMKRLTFPRQSAVGLKKTLHGIFESFYQFDLDFLRKENLSKSQAQFEKFKGVSPFVVAYAIQHGLGGHSIPLDRAMMFLFYTLGIISEEEVVSGHVTGLERTIPKSQGVEFASSVHQFAVAFLKSPFNTRIRESILKINPDAKDRFPKRNTKKVAPEEAPGDLPAEPTKVEEPSVSESQKPAPKKKMTKPTVKKPASAADKKKTGRPTKDPQPAPPQKKNNASKASKPAKPEKLPVKSVKPAEKKRPKPR
jgi:endonuclease III